MQELKKEVYRQANNFPIIYEHMEFHGLMKEFTIIYKLFNAIHVVKGTKYSTGNIKIEYCFIDEKMLKAIIDNCKE